MEVNMQKNIGIWIDHEKAYLITLTEEGETFETIESEIETRVRFEGETKNYSRLGNQFINPQKKKTERYKHQVSDYVHKIMEKISDASDLYIFGPAEAKIRLEKEIQKDKKLGPKIIKVESCDVLTEKQMIARVKDFYVEHLPPHKLFKYLIHNK